MSNKGRFTYKKLAKYPHMKQEDIITWNLFIEKYPKAYISVDYDFLLGKVEEHLATAAALNIAGAEAVNQYKADVIGYGESFTDIIEVKNKALPSTIGQVLTYSLLYKEDYPANPEPASIIVAREASFDLERIANAHGVHLLLV